VEALPDRGGELAFGLADRGAAIRLLARSGDRAFNESGREPDALAAASRELPGFEGRHGATLERMTRIASSSSADVAAPRDELAP
jgi:hypothetical protein